MRFTTRLRKEEDGQAIILLGLAMSFFLIAAVGLGIDGSHLYSQRTMAQTAADAVAQASVMSIFDGTTSGAGFTPSDKGTFTCSASNTTATPCKYASLNGFSFAKGDTITIEFYKSSDAPVSGVALSSSDTYPVVQATISRTVSTFLMRIAGTASSTAKATAIAAIVTVTSPTPLLITDPQNASSLTGNGNPTITICGGPTQSVQVNSSNTSGYDGGATVDLSHAGTTDTGNCTANGNANFGTWGGAFPNPGATFGSGTGQYVKVSPIQDPLANVSAPSDPGGTTPATKTLNAGAEATADGCTSPPCVLYFPGHYSSLVPGNNNVLFAPGLYYVVSGGVKFKQTTGGGTNSSGMCTAGSTDCPSDTNTGSGMLIYDTGPADAKGFAQTGGFTFDTNVSIFLQGPTITQTVNGQTVPGPPYYNVVLWEDRTAEKNSHTLGQGNGCFSVSGTIYITNTFAIMTNSSDANYPTHTQSVTYGGNPCSSTIATGDIIVSDLNLSGNKAAIKMALQPYGFLKVRQVALVQ